MTDEIGFPTPDIRYGKDGMTLFLHGDDGEKRRYGMADIHELRAMARQGAVDQGNHVNCMLSGCGVRARQALMVRLLPSEGWICLPHADPRDVAAQVEFLAKPAVFNALEEALQQTEPVMVATQPGSEDKPEVDKEPDQPTPGNYTRLQQEMLQRAGFGAVGDYTVAQRERTFAFFCAKVRDTMSGTAVTKGYNATGPDGSNPLDDFCGAFFPDHRLGEVVYKCVRFKRKRLLEDLEKAAAWLFLEWRIAAREEK